MNPGVSEATVAWPEAATSPSLQDQIQTAKVLVVGAGGIGCELLKTLVLTGFENIELIDMDTIETSNLNRQFLFRRRHVGESKAKIAAEAVKRFRPNANIVSHQANIKEARFGIDFFRGFQVVLNGLDNMEARRHVNRLCLAAGVPLVESGTEGYLGQVTVHIKGISECFECQPKAAPKSYPVCTIRNTPDKPIHCVVWAKELLFQRLFGRADVVTDLDEETQEEKAAGQVDDPSFFLRQDGEAAVPYARRIFERVFCSDIERVLRMDELWTTRERPTPLRSAELLGEEDSAANGDSKSAAQSASSAPEGQQPNSSAPSGGGDSGSASRHLGLLDSHKLWSLQDQARVFIGSVQRYLEERPGEVGAAVFDKEDPLAVDFVTAASNLRSAAYGIPMQSLFDTKGMAGNIIHAIATTNAIISGLIVVQALKILTGFSTKCKNAFLGQAPPKLVSTFTLSPPAPTCMVCGRTQLQLRINTQSTTLAQLIDRVLKKRLSLLEPSINTASFMYEEGEGLDPDEAAESAVHLPKTLAQLPGGGIGNGSTFQVSDQAQQLDLDFVVWHQEDFDEETEPEGYTLIGKVEAPVAAARDGAGPSAAGPSADISAGAAAVAAAEESDSGDLIMMSDEDEEEEQSAPATSAPQPITAENGHDTAPDAGVHAAQPSGTVPGVPVNPDGRKRKQPGERDGEEGPVKRQAVQGAGVGGEEDPILLD